MEIIWYGLSCFRLSERNKATVVTDPFGSGVGYALPKLKAAIVTVSHDAPGHNNTEVVKDAFPITGPGEYEIDSVFITGVDTIKSRKEQKNGSMHNIIYVFDYETITVCHLGDLNHVPSQTKVENLGTIDIALVPVGGGGGLNAAKAAEVISMLEPSIVIPMHYKTEHTNIDLQPLDKFLQEMGVADVEAQDSLVIKSRTTSEDTKVVVLNPRQ